MLVINYCLRPQITDQVEFGEYKGRLSDWETERHRQKYEFTITEDDPYADERVDSANSTVCICTTILSKI